MHCSLIAVSVILATGVAGAPTLPQPLSRRTGIGLGPEIPNWEVSCAACAQNLSETVPSCTGVATSNPFNPERPLASSVPGPFITSFRRLTSCRQHSDDQVHLRRCPESSRTRTRVQPVYGRLETCRHDVIARDACHRTCSYIQLVAYVRNDYG
ncbi:hypothetical protein DFH06DRAFT_1216449 [Mycena polygramma]|nr:hypothetical protein DFH06DRAFT_1216449 [Mycena polygramma]